MPEMRPFSITTPSLEEIAHRLAFLYKEASFSRDPMFKWVQLTNDVTILAEELRRPKREAETIERAAKVLWRLLEFIGYHLYVIRPADQTLGGEIARQFRRRSYTDLMPKGLPEGPSRWILAKYPFACSKCGRAPCQCVLAPWVLEGRRQDPETYLKRYKKKADKARRRLRTRLLQRFTLQSYLKHFTKIYRNTYYHQEEWKIGMHLVEEVGEATIELSRIDLGWRAGASIFKRKDILARARKTTQEDIEKDIGRIISLTASEMRKADVAKEMKQLESRLKRQGRKTFLELVGDKFKEEVADVFSWLAAIISKLDPKYERFSQLTALYSHQDEGKDTKRFGCAWCKKPQCDNACLVSHSLSREMLEKVTQF